MHVIHLTASRFFGGPERQMLGLAEALRPEVDSAFIVFQENGLYRTFLNEVQRAGFKGHVLLHDTPRLLAALRELVLILGAWKADALVCHSIKPNLLGLLAARRLGIPVIAVSRGWTGETLRVRFYDALDRRVLRLTDKVVCVSEAQAVKVRRAGVRDDKVTVIHNAIRPERFDNPDPAYRGQLLRMFPNPPQQVVGAAGRLSPEKGFNVLVDAAAEVLKCAGKGDRRLLPERPSGCCVQKVPVPFSGVGFVLFGDGTLRESLTRQIAARGLEGRFILAGFRSDLDQFLPHFDLMVLPSFSEGLPNVALEALAARVPVVATAVGGTPEVIEDGQTGYLVPPDDPASLADRMISALSDRAIRSRFIAQGRDGIARRFSFVTQAAMYQDLFARCEGDGALANEKRNPPAAVAAPSPASDKIKILFLIDDFCGPEGGTEQHLLFLQRELPRDQFDLYFGVLTRIRRIDPVEFPVPPVMLNGGRRGLLGVPSRLRRLMSFIKAAEIDVVHAFSRRSELYACLAVRLAGRGKVLGIRRNIGHWHTWRSRWTARLVGFLGAEYAANCEAAREFAARVEWIPRRRVSVIHNPAPRKRLEEGLASVPPRSSLGIVDGEQVVGMVATVKPVKDYATYLRAAKLVLQEHPRTRFLAVGCEEPDYKHQMEQLARELGIERQVTWLGPIPNPLTVVPLFDVAVLSSRSEALSNAVLEYAAAGVAIVATDVGGTREIVEDEQTGFIVPPGDPWVMADRIMHLLSDAPFRRMIATSARRRAETVFFEGRVLDEYAKLYAHLVGRPSGAPAAAPLAAL
jgi:glycosyltransferase involved in cell wall biosynthesis